MPKELTRAQKLKKYNVPKEILVHRQNLMYAGEEYCADELIERIERINAEHPTASKKVFSLESDNDYYDSYYNLVFSASRPLTIEEEDVLIGKAEKLAEKKSRSFEKAKAAYIKQLKKKYPDYKLPEPEETNAFTDARGIPDPSRPDGVQYDCE